MRAQSVRWKIAQRHLNHRRSQRLRWFSAFLAGILIASTAAGSIAALYVFSQLPSASAFQLRYSFQSARIFDSRGKLLYTLADVNRGQGQRMVEPLQAVADRNNACAGGINRIPLDVQNATIATEDATFYSNPGFDLLSIVRAAYDDLRAGRIVSGASTITQQVVRNTLLSGQRYQQSLDRKAQEVALAYELTRKYTKRQILSYYLNSVPYGNQAYGAQAGSEVYFGIPVCRLDLAQAAFLAGLPRAPTTYNPFLHPAVALSRMREVVGTMKLHGYIHSPAEAAALMAEAARWHFKPPQTVMQYPHFVRYVIQQLRRNPTIAPVLYRGLDVYTTLDSRLQDVAQNDVTTQINSLAAQHVTDGALVSLDLRPARYGWILAMIGSANYAGRAGQINMADSPRQPGSSMKPFNYVRAFQQGVYPGTTVRDSPLILPDPSATQSHGWYEPIDYDHQFHGVLTVREALANSLNVPAVKVEYYVTRADHVAATAYKFGMRSLYRDNPGIGCAACYATTLGGIARGTRLLEETAAYGVFASGGWTMPTVAIWKVIQRSTGKVLYCSEDCPAGVTSDPVLSRQRHHVLDAGHAYEMTNVLADNNARCQPSVCEFGLNSDLLLSHDAAAKTGTTNNFTDNWTVGYTPQVVTGVWVGNADNTPMQNVSGITGAAPIWHDYMESAFGILALPNQPFVNPGSVVTSSRCLIPGSTFTSLGYPDLYVQGDPIPMCRIPDKGTMPVTCAQYPKPLPIGWQCISGYTYTYGGVQSSFTPSFAPPFGSSSPLPPGASNGSVPP